MNDFAARSGRSLPWGLRRSGVIAIASLFAMGSALAVTLVLTSDEKPSAPAAAIATTQPTPLATEVPLPVEGATARAATPTAEPSDSAAKTTTTPSRAPTANLANSAACTAATETETEANEALRSVKTGHPASSQEAIEATDDVARLELDVKADDLVVRQDEVDLEEAQAKLEYDKLLADKVKQAYGLNSVYARKADQVVAQSQIDVDTYELALQRDQATAARDRQLLSQAQAHAEGVLHGFPEGSPEVNAASSVLQRAQSLRKIACGR